MYRDLTKRILALALSVCMIAGMVDLSGLTVHAADDADNLISIGSDVTVDRSSPIEYDGSAKTPNVTVVARESGATLAQGTDYRLEYDNNVNAGSAGVTVINLNNEADRKRATFTIAQRDINSGTFPSSADLAQEISNSDATVTPAIDITDSGNKDHTDLVGIMSSTSVADVDYTYTFLNNRGPGTATVRINGRNNYTGTKSIDFEISLLDAAKLSFDFVPAIPARGKVYTGQDIEPTVGNVKYDGTPLTTDQYEVRYANNCYAGDEAEAWIVGKGSRFGGLESEHKTFRISKNISKSYASDINIWAEDIEPQSYAGGTDVELDGAKDIKLHDPDYKNKLLEFGKDFEITGYANHQNEGIATVTLHGIGCYSDYLDLHYEIIATQLSSGMVDTTGATYVYDGTDQFDKVKAAIVVSNNGVEYKQGVDYSVSRVAGDAGTSAGKHKIAVTPLPSGQLTGNTVEATYTVEQKDLSDSRTIKIDIVNYTDKEYTGQQKKPEVEIVYTPQNGRAMTLKAGQDYEAALSYNNNINATTDTSKATVWAVGKGNFKGSTARREFDIEPIQLTDQNTTITGFADNAEFTYTGNAIEPNVNVVHSTKGTLRKGTDYTVTYENNTDVGSPGTALVKIAGTGNYQGQFQKRFTIVRCDISTITVSVPASVQFTGTQLMPEVTVRHGTKTLVEDTDYTLEYGPNIDKGSGSVKVLGIGNYKGEVNKTFAITARSITSGTLSMRAKNEPYYDFTIGTANDHYYPYTGEQVTFELTVSYTNAEAGMQNIELTAGVDYDLEFKPGVTAIGTAQATIRAKGNYTGSKPVNFTVKGNLADYGNPSAFTSVQIPEQIYTSNPITPSNAEVIFAGKTLTNGKDYEVVCENNDNTDAGIASAKIVGKGDYYGAAEPVQFDIRKFNLATDDFAANNFVINNVKDSYDFIEVNESIQPVPKITHNGNDRTQDLHYYVEYGDNNKIGKGSLTIKGDDVNYEGEHKIEFDITPYDLGKGETAGHVEVQGVEDVILDAVIAGEDVNAEMLENAVVMSNLRVQYTALDINGAEMGTRELDLGTEYSIYYQDNTRIGEATITINGVGNFGGTITKTFKIRGDLSSDRTEMTIEDCDYSPTGNTPEPTVTYTYDSGVKETLTAGVDYVVNYENNTDATAKSGAKAKAVITPVMEADGVTVKGNYAQSGDAKEAEFEIRQRDLTNAIESEGIEKDPALDVTGLVEEGYEFNGLNIIPELVISCNKLNLGVGTDYKISAINNKNVYTFAESEDGGRGERLMPTVIVQATQDEDGNYTGNYKGGFQMEFKINPREISADTVKTLLRVNGESFDDTRVPEVDYKVGETITFPLNPADPTNTKNDIAVTWSKQIQGTVQSTPLVEDQDYSVTYEDNNRIGEAKIIMSAVEYSNYTGSYERTFKIMASIAEADVENSYIRLDYDHNVPFGIVDVYPDLIFTDTSAGADVEPYILEKDKDFEIVTAANQGTATEISRNNRNVASETLAEDERPTVIIRGIGCYRGIIKRYYNITPKNLSTDEGDITITFEGAINSEEYENAFVYTGSAIEPVVKVYNHGQLMQPDVDYTVAGFVNNTAISTESRKASVIIRAVDGGNYLGQKTFEFNIIRRPIEGMHAELVGDNPVYSRTAKTPNVEVSYMNGTEKVVLTKNDYDITYENNINAATQYAGDDAPVAIITGKNAYGGSLKLKFTIEPEPIDESNDDFDMKASPAPYTGMAASTTVTVKAKDGTLLEEEKDYLISGYRDNVSAGTGYVTIRGNGNYTGTRDIPFQIVPPDVSQDFRVTEIPEQTFTGKPIEPEVIVTLAVGDQEIPLTENDYELLYENNTDAGTATLIVKGAGNFAGEKRVEFTILPKSIGTEEGIDADMLLAPIEDQLYTGMGVTPDVDLRLRSQVQGQAEGADDGNTDDDENVGGDDENPGGDGDDNPGGDGDDNPGGDDENPGGDGEDENAGRLVLGKDYTLSYLTNVAVGTASVNIVGIGNYSGNINTQFRILGPMNLAEVSSIPPQPYTGSEVKPVPEVYFAGKKLTEGEEYTLAYADNIAQGTATITITGMGEWYTGEKLVTFEIARDFSEETIIKGLASAYTFTGKAITPAILVEDHGRILSKDVDYTVSYSNNINVGTATVTIKGAGRYDGTASATFKIAPQNIGRATTNKIADQTYTGKKLNPSVTISSDGIVLKNGTDYSISHVNSQNPGKASVVIKGKGNFTGTKTINYNIIVPKVTGVKVSSYTASSITFSWKQNKVVTGYEIYNSKNRRVAFVRKNSTLKATVSKLKAGTSAKFRVRAYVNQGQYYYSSFVTITASTAPKATKITSISSTKPKQVALKWKKVAKATNYQVYRSTSKKGKYKKIATTSKTSYTDKKATNGKTYYYKIRASKKVGSKTYNSKYSSVKSVAAKK